MRLSVFRGGWRLAEATAVTGATLALLLGLVDKSLVRVTGQQRFDLHELVRQYAAEQLSASDEGNLIRQRHYAAYLHLFRTGDSHLRGAEAATWLESLAAEQDNLRHALQWALDEAHYIDAAWLMLAVAFFWHLRGNWYESGRYTAQLLPHRQALAVDLRLAILIHLWAVARALEEFQPFDRWADEIRQLLEVCSAKLLQAAVWHFTAAHAADFAQAAAAYEHCIRLARTADAAPGLGAEFCLVADRDFVLGNAIWAYAGLLLEQGELARAATLTMESLTLFKRRGNRYETVDSLGNLGYLALLQGDLTEAHTYLGEAVAIAATFNYQEMLGSLQPLLGLVTLYTGDVAAARRLLNEGLKRCIELKDKRFLARVYRYLAELALCEGEVTQAEQWLAQSLADEADRHQFALYEVGRLWVAARLATAQQAYVRAATLFGVADQMHSQLHHVIAGPMSALADAALTTVRAVLDPPVFAKAFARGQQMALAEAFATLLPAVHRASTRHVA